MRRRSRRWLAGAGVLVGLAVGAVALREVAGADAEAVPTVRVEAGRLLRQVAAEGVLAAVGSTPLSLPPTLRMPMRIAWLAEDGSPVAAGDAVVRFDPTEMEKSLVDARDDLRSAELRQDRTAAQSESELTRLGYDAALAELELDDARDFLKKDETLFSHHEIVESEIDQELASRRLEHAESARGSRARLSSAELELIAIERRKAGHSIDRAREGLDALELTAPRDGILVLTRDWRGEQIQVGETVWPGSRLGEIPELGAMKAEVWVLEADAGGLAVGQAAEVVVEAHPARRYAATVARVDSLAKPRQRGSPVQYFSVTLDLAETVPEVMKPGQRVRAWIDLGEVAGALAVPRQAVFQRDGRNLVYRRSAGGGFEAVFVELGPAAMGRVAVAEGLAAGDEVALVDPTRGPAPDEGAGEAGGVGLPGAPGEVR